MRKTNLPRPQPERTPFAGALSSVPNEFFPCFPVLSPLDGVDGFISPPSLPPFQSSHAPFFQSSQQHFQSQGRPYVRQATPYLPPLLPPGPCISGEAPKYLHGLRSEVSYISYPSREAVKKYDSAGICHLVQKGYRSLLKPPEVEIFIGQVPNLLALSYLAWFVDLIAGEFVVVRIERIESKDNTKQGYVRAHVRDQKAAEVLFERSKTMLFDLNGVWYPKNEEELTKLRNHIKGISDGKIFADPRMPKACMVLERSHPRYEHPSPEGPRP